jgi:hypothetical protein
MKALPDSLQGHVIVTFAQPLSHSADCGYRQEMSGDKSGANPHHHTPSGHCMVKCLIISLSWSSIIQWQSSRLVSIFVASLKRS